MRWQGGPTGRGAGFGVQRVRETLEPGKAPPEPAPSRDVPNARKLRPGERRSPPSAFHPQTSTFSRSLLAPGASGGSSQGSWIAEPNHHHQGKDGCYVVLLGRKCLRPPKGSWTTFPRIPQDRPPWMACQRCEELSDLHFPEFRGEKLPQRGLTVAGALDYISQNARGGKSAAGTALLDYTSLNVRAENGQSCAQWCGSDQLLWDPGFHFVESLRRASARSLANVLPHQHVSLRRVYILFIGRLRSWVAL